MTGPVRTVATVLQVRKIHPYLQEMAYYQLTENQHIPPRSQAHIPFRDLGLIDRLGIPKEPELLDALIAERNQRRTRA